MIYAIDFGTTNSLLAAADEKGAYAPIPLDAGAPDPTLFRSVLYFPHPQKVFFGSEAIREYVANDLTGRLLRSVKKFLPDKSFVGTFVDNKPFYLEDIIAAFLTEMRKRGNAHFQKDVKSVVLGRPARFSTVDAEDKLAQDRLESAAKKAGFQEISFCAEPLAAAHEFQSTLTETKTVFVADFGGGTSDFTVAKISPGAEGKLEVLAIGGISLAGDAYDGCIMRERISENFGAKVQYKAPFGSNVLTMPVHLMEKICSPAEISILRERDTQAFLQNIKSWSLGSEDKEKMENLHTLIHDQIGFSVFEEIESTKRKLSDQEKAQFLFKYVGLVIQEEISRREFQEYSKFIHERIVNCLDETLQAAGLSASDIDLVCATGGTAKVLALREALNQRFGAQKVEQRKEFHSIVTGLAAVAKRQASIS